MHVVVNHLYLASPVSETALMALEFEVLPACREIPGFVSVQLVRVDEEHHMLVAVGESPETIDRINTGTCAAWVSEHLRPLLVKPAERYVGKVLTSPGT
jgi:hypothetical protein